MVSICALLEVEHCSVDEVDRQGCVANVVVDKLEVEEGTQGGVTDELVFRFSDLGVSDKAVDTFSFEGIAGSSNL